MTHKILIADDEPNIVISLEYLLQREGYAVVIARDGNEALDSIARERPDLADTIDAIAADYASLRYGPGEADPDRLKRFHQSTRNFRPR